MKRSPKRTDVLDKVVAHRLPTSSSVRWNFHSRAINTVFEHKEGLIRCFETIRDSGDFDPVTTREAGGFAILLEDQDFNFFLQLFHNIMPHVEILYAKLQKKDIDSVHIKGSIQQDIQKIRNSLHSLVNQSSEGASQPKRRRSLSPEVHEQIATEILITTPMTTAEAERCFSTFKRVKTFLRNSMTQERLNALAMLSMEKRMVTEIIDFNQKVIEKFASQKGEQNVF
ncbi:putative zinc finger MYM-type protein 1-like [Triplophysa rosa]|uniref:Zinc finger MYM-type protein 1-like n=1 Tax=Triplophysa rosa TaxID=992332 RepID=A0A9W7T505_TRIRA|nr:putative zinc finger MYM-type protein 1-like [Triplophysa rosa]